MTVNTICILRNTGTIQIMGTWSYKIIQLTVFVRGEWGVDENLWTFAEEGELPKSDKYGQGGRGPNFGHFVIT